jgi:hypothetical protein
MLENRIGNDGAQKRAASDRDTRGSRCPGVWSDRTQRRATACPPFTRERSLLEPPLIPEGLLCEAFWRLGIHADGSEISCFD